MAKPRTFQQESLGLLTMLALQFVLGMILNLFVELPKIHPGQSGNYFVRSWHSYGWAITFGGGVTLFLHVLIATGLLIGSIRFMFETARSGKRNWTWLAATGLVGILAAFSNGLSFVDFNKDVSSFIMAMGYVVATVSYSMGLTWVEGRPARTAT